jgi:hypothetical protein
MRNYDVDVILRTLRNMTMLASQLRNTINQNSPDEFTEDYNEELDDALDRAWDVYEAGALELSIENAPESTDEDDYDDSDPQDARDRADYEAGKAQAEMRRAEREMYGEGLAAWFHAQDDLNAYNRGDE